MIDIKLDSRGNFEVSGLRKPQEDEIRLVNDDLTIKTRDLGVRAEITARVVETSPGEKVLHKDIAHFADSEDDVRTFFEECEREGFPEYHTSIRLAPEVAGKVRNIAAGEAVKKFPEGEDMYLRKREIFTGIIAGKILLGETKGNISTSLSEADNILSIRRFIPER